MLDKTNRDLIQKKELLEQEKKKISKSRDKSLFKKSKELSKQINELEIRNNEFFKNHLNHYDFIIDVNNNIIMKLSERKKAFIFLGFMNGLFLLTQFTTMKFIEKDVHLIKIMGDLRITK